MNDQRNRQSAPYYKLKMVMDYWCGLWFWDMRQAVHLPNRQQYINDIASILNLDLTVFNSCSSNLFKDLISSLMFIVLIDPAS